MLYVSQHYRLWTAGQLLGTGFLKPTSYPQSALCPWEQLPVKTLPQCCFFVLPRGQHQDHVNSTHSQSLLVSPAGSGDLQLSGSLTSAIQSFPSIHLHPSISTLSPETAPAQSEVKPENSPSHLLCVARALTPPNPVLHYRNQRQGQEPGLLEKGM